MKGVTRLLVCLLALSVVAGVRAEPYRLTFAGGASAGLYAVVGAGLDQVVRDAHPGSVVTYQPSGGGGIANVALVSGGTAGLGIVADIEARLAWEGADPFRGPSREIRVLAWAYGPQAGVYGAGFLANREFAESHGLHALSDLAVRKPPVRIGILPASNLYWKVMEALLEEVGVSQRDIESWGGGVFRGASPTQVDLMSDRRIDITAMGYAPGLSAIEQMRRAVPLRALELPESAIAGVQKRYGGEPCTFPAASDPALGIDLHTLCFGALIIVSKAMPDEAAYDIARALVEGADRYRAGHPLLAKVDDEQFAQEAPIPFHPGAQRYFREAGLLR